MSSVLQDWVTELPLMMQGTMLTGIRGNDTAHAPKMKPVVRFMRANILEQGNPENDFMDIGVLPGVEEFEDELEYMSVHYFRHFLLTLEILAYEHPEFLVSNTAMDYYLRLVNWCHLAPESHEELTERLSGKPGTTGTSKTWIPESRKVLPATDPIPKKDKKLAFTPCGNCGHAEFLHKMSNGYQPYGHCNYQHLCGCSNYISALSPVHKNQGGNAY